MRSASAAGILWIVTGAGMSWFFIEQPHINGGVVMLAVLFWILFSLMLLIVIPDPWSARREIAKRQAQLRRESRRARFRPETDAQRKAPGARGITSSG